MQVIIAQLANYSQEKTLINVLLATIALRVQFQKHSVMQAHINTKIIRVLALPVQQVITV